MLLTVVIRYFLRPFFRLCEDLNQREGDIDGAQIYRLLQLPRTGISLLSFTDLWQPVERYIQVGFKLRFSIQREVYLRAKHDSLYEIINANPSTEDTSTWVNDMQTYKTELHSLKKTIWSLQREAHRCMNAIPDGPLKRMLCAHEGRDDWYLSKFLREECARSGGCCERECGCCEKPRNDKGYPINVENYENDPMVVDVFLRGFRNFSHSYAGKSTSAPPILTSISASNDMNEQARIVSEELAQAPQGQVGARQEATSSSSV
ncbi:hypothetical protein AnigIFM56816_002272 [Aspergillus niger]|nr:hypothetical protein AnigIFM56816_002272 [Aspergillus niger]